MDMIGVLPDVLLLKILSLLPAKDVVATMVLSKRWQCLWMMVPKLVYDDDYQNPKYESFSRFVDRSLFLHEAQVIETLHFKLGQICGSGDIGVWIRAADKCCVRELIIDTSSSSKTQVTLPKSLYSGGCRKVVTLKLSNAILVDVSSSISFPSLKNLSLISMTYQGGDEFFKRLLSGCPVLEDLVVQLQKDDNVDILNVRLPSLKSLVLDKRFYKFNNKAHGFVIDAPSLECLDIADYSQGFHIVNMPNIVKANVDVTNPHTDQLLGSITLVKRLHLCIRSSKDAYPVDSVFCNLVHLKICTCEIQWFNLLMRVLRDSPNLRVLQLKEHHYPGDVERLCWIEPDSVPKCLLSSLETVEWEEYNGTEEEKEVAAFILRSGSCLKKVTISSESTDCDKKLEMLKELALSFRRSPTCQLVFN